MSRSRGSFTGGTGDIKPQIMTLEVINPSAAAKYSITGISLPVNRVSPGKKNMAQVVEILKVDWYLNVENLGDTGTNAWAFLTTSPFRARDDAATLTTLNIDIVNSKSFAIAVQSKIIATSGTFLTRYPISIDLTDNNGNGMLVASDKLTGVCAFLTPAVLGTCNAKILYRLVNVSITEYVGILQSQL